MDYKIEQRYQTFLARLQYSPISSTGIPIFYFRDCMNIGSAFALSKRGHRCIIGNKIIPSAVKLYGFSEKEIDYLFSIPKISKKRKYKCQIYNRNYRKRKGVLAHNERRKINIDQYKKILKLRKTGILPNKCCL